MIDLSKEGTQRRNEPSDEQLKYSEKPLPGEERFFVVPPNSAGGKGTGFAGVKKGGTDMGKLSEKRCGEVLHAYFEEGLETEEIARRMKLSQRSVQAVLSDKRRLAPYHTRSEAAKIRAQICVNESAEEAARKQAQLLRDGETAQAVTQRAAKDILDRAGVRVEKEDRREVTIRFSAGMPRIGTPQRREDEEWTSC